MIFEALILLTTCLLVKIYGFNFLRKFSSKSIPIHKSKTQVDTTKLHEINQDLHEKLGPIYKERLGPDVEIVWIAEPRYVLNLFMLPL